MSGDVLHIGTTPEFEQPVWWGLTVGSLAYAVRAKNSRQAIGVVAASLGRTSEDMVMVPTIVHPHDEESQPLLTERYPERELVRVIPFSMVEYPENVANMTPDQTEACERAWGPRPTE